MYKTTLNAYSINLVIISHTTKKFFVLRLNIKNMYATDIVILLKHILNLKNIFKIKTNIADRRKHWNSVYLMNAHIATKQIGLATLLICACYSRLLCCRPLSYK